MKYRLISFISIMTGLILALFMLQNSEVIQSARVFNVITLFILRGITFLTSILLLSSLCISVNQLLRNNNFWKTIRYFFTGSVIIYLATQLLAFLVSKISFLPKDQVPDIVRLNSSLSLFGLDTRVWDTIHNIKGFFSWVFTFSQLSTSHFVIWLAFFCAIAFVMRHDMEIAEPSYNLLDSISRLIFRLLQNIFVMLSTYLIIYIIYTVWQLQNNDLLNLYLGFVTRMLLITTLLFIGTPLFLFFFYKDKRAHLFLWQNFLSIFTAFLTGNAMLSMGTLIVEQKNRLAMPRNITGLLNPLNMLFLRPGSAIVLAYSFITYYSSNTRWQLNFFPEIFWLILVPVGFAIIIGLFSLPNYSVILPFYLVLFGLGTTDTFIIMTPILLLGQSFASCIDALSWNLLNYIYKRFYNNGTD